MDGYGALLEAAREARPDVESGRATPQQSPEANLVPWPATRARTKVYLYFHVYSVSRISTANQSFECFFYFRATWLSRKKKQDNGKDDFEKLGTTDPQLMFMNALGDVKLADAQVVESSDTYRKACPPNTKGQVVVEYKAKARGAFRFAFDPSDFPYDKQLLTMVLSTSDPSGTWEFLEDVYDTTRSVLRDEFHAEPGYSIRPSGNDGTQRQAVKDHKLFFLKTDYFDKEDFFSATSTTRDVTKLKKRALFCYPFKTKQGNRVDVLTVGVLVRRTDSHYYLVNIVLPCVVIGLASFIVFAVSRSNTYQRVSFLLAQVLFLMPSKYVVGGSLPRTGQTTACDVVVFGSFAYVLVMLGLVVLSAQLVQNTNEHSTKVQYEHTTRRFAVGVFVVAYASLASYWLYRRRSAGTGVQSLYDDAQRLSEEKSWRGVNKVCDNSEIPDFDFPGRGSRYQNADTTAPTTRRGLWRRLLGLWRRLFLSPPEV